MESASLFHRISRLSLYVLGALIPLWFLPITQNSLDFQKQALLAVLVFAGVVTWMAALLQAGKATIRLAWQAPLLLAFLAAGLLSVLFSLWPARRLFCFSFFFSTF